MTAPGPRRVPIALLALVALLPLAAAEVGSAVVPPPAPRIVAVQFFEDLEDGRRYNLVADVSRGPERVAARTAGIRAKGRRSRRIGPGGGSRGTSSWFFRRRRLVRAVRADLAEDGVARLGVRASNLGGTTRVRCRLVLEPDPVHGDFAGGDCKRA